MTDSIIHRFKIVKEKNKLLRQKRILEVNARDRVLRNLDHGGKCKWQVQLNDVGDLHPAEDLCKAHFTTPKKSYCVQFKNEKERSRFLNMMGTFQSEPADEDINEFRRSTSSSSIVSLARNSMNRLEKNCVFYIVKKWGGGSSNTKKRILEVDRASHILRNLTLHGTMKWRLLMSQIETVNIIDRLDARVSIHSSMLTLSDRRRHEFEDLPFSIRFSGARTGVLQSDDQFEDGPAA